MDCEPRSISTRYNPAVDDAAIEQALRTFFQTGGPEVSAAYLFGSVARGTSGTTSDVDVGVLLARPPADGLAGLPLDLEADLERLLGVPAQVIVLNRAPVDLVHRVLRDGKLLVDRDPAGRIAFEVRARNEFFDLKPVLDQYRAVRGPDR
jgi:predicted nucleotidyltransferase